MNRNPELVRGLSNRTNRQQRSSRFFRRLVLTRLQSMNWGTLRIDDSEGSVTLGGENAGDAPKVQVVVHDLAFYKMLALGGSVGAAEAYILKLWDCDELTALMRLLVRNMHVLRSMEGGLARFSAPLLAWFHRRHRNSIAGSKRNIAAHYDLGNDLFELFLDRSMMYSSGIHTGDTNSLEQAQREKLDRICRRLNLTCSDHVLEIGTGWGGFALHAAREYGARVTTTTISRQQYEWARQAVEKAGLGHRIELKLEDYRQLEGQFDKLVSIEMIEAIGAEHMPAYFNRCMSLLKPQGEFLLQAITIEEHRYARAVRSVDFIKRYVFPGSFIPSVAAMMGEIATHSDFALLHQEDFGDSYARTLREWKRRFNGALDSVRALGYPEHFIRMWNYYLSYCEGGFMERAIGVSQLHLARPLWRRDPVAP